MSTKSPNVGRLTRKELPARSAGGFPDGLKMNYAQMQLTELKTVILKAVEANDLAPLTEEEARFLDTVHIAALAFEVEIRLGQPASERRCRICHASVRKCCC